MAACAQQRRAGETLLKPAAYVVFATFKKLSFGSIPTFSRELIWSAAVTVGGGASRREAAPVIASIDARETGLSVLLIEQNAPLSLAVADRVYVIDDGKVVHSGRAAELAKDKDLVEKLAGAKRRAMPATPLGGAAHT